MFQVSFYWAEAEARSLPDPMLVPVGRLRLAMAGTERPTPRCDALLGDVGVGVACSLYERRPSPCRDFTASWARGVAEDGCDRARLRHGLVPLSLADWEGVEPDEPDSPERPDGPEPGPDPGPGPDGPGGPEPQRPRDPKVPNVA